MEGLGHSSDESEVSAHIHGSGDAGMSTMNLYATLGLCPEDVDALAQIPESEISVETLPFLIMQLKAKRAQEQEQQRGASPKIDGGKEPTGIRDNHRDDSPTLVDSRRSNSLGDTDYRRVVSYKRIERSERMGGKRECHHTRLRDKIPDSRPRFPLSYQVDDFHGATPKEFPHTCSLCFCMSNSKKTWTSHVNGLRHAEGKRELMHQYPDWERPETSRDMPDRDDYSPPRKAPRHSMPHKRTHSADGESGETWPEAWPIKHNFKPKAGTKVVVTKWFRPGGVVAEDLLILAKPFGTVVKHLVYSCKGFLEFSSHKEAVNMVDHFADKPPYVKRQKLTSMYLSPIMWSINAPRLDETEKRGPKLVCFSRLPPGKDIELEVLNLVKLFGDVRQCNFLSDQATIEMVDWNDADIMVKYYYSNPLKINGERVKVSFASHKRNRESPESSRSRRGDSSKSHSYRHKSDDAAKSSTNKEKWTDKQPPEADKEHPETNEQPPEAHKQPPEADKQAGKADKQAPEADKPPAEADKQPPETGKKPAEELENHQSTLGNHEDLDSERTLYKEQEQQDGIKVEDETSLLDDVDLETCADVESDKPEVEPGPSISVSSSIVNVHDNIKQESSELSTEKEVVDSDQKAAADPALRDPDISVEEEQESFHEDDEDMDSMDFPENMDDFVTLDELDDMEEEDTFLDSTETQDGRVVVIKPIKRSLKAYGLEQALFKLAEPFGKVINHVISFWRQVARLELDTSEAAHEMVKALKEDWKKSQIFGQHVEISMCRRLKKLETPSGRSIYIGMLPFRKYSHFRLLRLAQPFGKITGYSLDWRQRRCLIQMETVEAAQMMLKKYEQHRPRFFGSTLKICMSTKGDSLIPWKHPAKLDVWLAQKNSSKGLPADHGFEEINNHSAMGEDGSLSDCEGVCGDLDDDDDASSASVADPVGEDTTPKEPLHPYQNDNPVGLNYLVQRTGFLCRLCNVFYTNEKIAKSVHCTSMEHYQNLKTKKPNNKLRRYMSRQREEEPAIKKFKSSDSGCSNGDSERYKACHMCKMTFHSAVVAESHYRGKVHARNLKLKTSGPLTPVRRKVEDGSSVASSSGHAQLYPDLFCPICHASFPNHLMAQQHYEGKKHKHQLAKTELMGSATLASTVKGYPCMVCNIKLNSMEQYQLHISGAKHKKQVKKVDKTVSTPPYRHPQSTLPIPKEK